MASIENLLGTCLDESADAFRRLDALKELGAIDSPAAYRALCQAARCPHPHISAAAEEQLIQAVGRILRRALAVSPEAASKYTPLLQGLTAALLDKPAAASPTVARTGKAGDTAAEVTEPAPHASATGIEQIELLPDVEALTGPCMLLLVGGFPAGSEQLVADMANAVQTPVFDLRRDVNAGHGVLVREVDARTARELLRLLEQNGVKAAAVPKSLLWALPPVHRAASCGVDDAGMACSVAAYDMEEPIRVGWDDVLVLSGARLQLETVRIVTIEKPRLLGKPVKLERNVTDFESITLLDVFCRNPWRRIRLGEKPPDLSALGLTGGMSWTQIDVPDVVSQLLALPEPPLFGPGVATLASGNDPADALTFASRPAYEMFTLRVVHLARFGFLPLEPAE